MTITLRRSALAVPAAALLTVLGAGPALAAPQTVTGGQLDWTQVNNYQTPAEPAPNASNNRTYLGFFTRNTSPGHMAGSVSAAGAAWGDTLTPASLRGPAALTTWSFPVVGGTYDAADGTGVVKLLGTVRFVSPPAIAPNIGFDYTVSIEDPLVRLNGDAAELYASGQSATQAGPAVTQTTYDRSAKIYDLNLTGAARTAGEDGLRIGPIAPTLVRSDIFPGVAAPSGPERTPNFWGSFALHLVTPTTGPKGEAGDAGAAGATGPAGAAGLAGAVGAVGPVGAKGKDGRDGRDAATLVAHLRTAPFGGTRTRRVVLQRRGKVVGTGTLRRATLRLTLRDGAQAGAGSYTLRLWGTRTSKSVRIG